MGRNAHPGYHHLRQRQTDSPAASTNLTLNITVEWEVDPSVRYNITGKGYRLLCHHAILPDITLDLMSPLVDSVKQTNTLQPGTNNKPTMHSGFSGRLKRRHAGCRPFVLQGVPAAAGFGSFWDPAPAHPFCGAAKLNLYGSRDW